MFERTHASVYQLIKGSLLPSRVSLSVCALVGFVIIVLHVLLAAVNGGALLPNFLDGQWAYAYGTIIKVPLAALLRRSSVHNVLMVLIWGLAGLLIYTIAERAIKNYREWREAEKDIQVINPEKVIQHPAKREFIFALAWRGAMACLLAIWAVIALLLAHQMFAYPLSLPSFAGIQTGFVRSLLLVGVEWMLLAHVLVVILRLSARRIRLFSKHMPLQEMTFFRS